jgi:hypothetical protein|nr:MAG TPA: cysteine-rich protein [Caudoviricetes sp.]
MRSFLWQGAIYIEKVDKKKVDKKKVVCPYCGHPVNAMQTEDAHCRGIYFRCKNKDCKKIFELKL